MKKRINLYSALLAVIMVLASCSKPPENLDDVQHDVKPSPLVVKAGKVNAQINVTFPAKFIPKKAVVELIPVLTYEGGEIEGKSVTIQGEKVEDNNTAISYANGGSIAIPISFDFKKELRKSELKVKAKIVLGGKDYTTPAIKVADGVMAMETLVVDEQSAPALGVDKFQRVVPDVANADIHYLIQQAYVSGKELGADDIKALKAFVKEAKAAENKEFAGVDISSYASPDGPEALNDKLAQRRESAAQKFINRELKRAKVAELSNEGFVDSKYTPEDWDGFKDELESSSIQDKELILRVLSMYNDPETREKEIKNLAAAYKELADDILPKLRRSKMAVNVNVIGHSDEEISALAANNPAELSVEELLYAATLVEGSDAQLDIYKKVTANYPKDWRGYNDMGYVYFKTWKFEEAEAAFVKAQKADAEAPEVLNNLGVIALVNNDVAKAKEYFGKAGSVEELTYNLGLVNIHEGNYAAAVKNLGNCACNNAALAKILTEDYKGAMATLNSIKNPICMTDYLKAIVAAKTNDKDLALASLKAGIAKNAKMKEMAKTEIVFAEYFEDAEFKSIVE